MFSTTFRLVLAGTCTLGMGMHSAGAQTIERIRLSDNDLTCPQIYAEVQQMDTVIQLAGPGLPAAPQVVRCPSKCGASMDCMMRSVWACAAPASTRLAATARVGSRLVVSRAMAGRSVGSLRVSEAEIEALVEGVRV